MCAWLVPMGSSQPGALPWGFVAGLYLVLWFKVQEERETGMDQANETSNR